MSAANGVAETVNSQRNVFVQELLLATLTEQLNLGQEVGGQDNPTSILESLKSPQSEEEQVEEGQQGVAVLAKTSSSSKENKSSQDPHSKHRNMRSEKEKLSDGGASCASSLSEKYLVQGQGTPRPVSTATSGSGSNFREASSWGYASSSTSSSSGSPRQVCSPITVGNTVAVHGPTTGLSSQGSQGGMNVMPGRASSAPLTGRDTRGLDPASVKRSMLKHMPPQRGASDMDPPPH